MKCFKRSSILISFYLPFVFSHASFAQSPQPIQSTETFRSFRDWCLRKEKLSQETKYTVDALLKNAGTSDCQQANSTLSNLSELEFYNEKISDLRLLQSLSNLRVLRVFISLKLAISLP